jgi:hypothetical protein
MAIGVLPDGGSGTSTYLWERVDEDTLGWAYMTLGQAEDALQQLRLVQRLLPDDPLTAALIESIAGGFPQPR